MLWRLEDAKSYQKVIKSYQKLHSTDLKVIQNQCFGGYKML